MSTVGGEAVNDPMSVIRNSIGGVNAQIQEVNTQIEGTNTRISNLTVLIDHLSVLKNQQPTARQAYVEENGLGREWLTIRTSVGFADIIRLRENEKQALREEKQALEARLTTLMQDRDRWLQMMVTLSLSVAPSAVAPSGRSTSCASSVYSLLFRSSRSWRTCVRSNSNNRYEPCGVSQVSMMSVAYTTGRTIQRREPGETPVIR